MVEPEESTGTDAGATSEAPRKRVPRPKPPVIDENDVPAKTDTAGTAEIDTAATEAVGDEAVESTEDVVAVDDVEPELAAELVTDDLAQAEGTTGDPIDTAALDAVADAPGAFGAPGTNSTPSANGVNGVKAVPQSTGTVTPSAFPAPAARPKRVAPALGIAALAVMIIRRRRRRR